MNTIKKLAILLLIPSTIFGAFQRKRKPITNHSSASVLPYCIHNKRAYVLLGEEQRSQGMCWTDFGGKKDPKETALQTAQRECYEESANVLGRGIINYKKAHGLFIGGHYFVIAPLRKKINLRVSDLPAIIENQSKNLRRANKRHNIEKTHWKWIELKVFYKHLLSVKKRHNHRRKYYSSKDLTLQLKNSTMSLYRPLVRTCIRSKVLNTFDAILKSV